MRITELKLREVGPFDSLDLSFHEGNDPTRADTVVFVGPNGSGKSTLLYALSGCFSPQISELAPRLRTRNSRVDVAASIGVSRTFTAYKSEVTDPNARPKLDDSGVALPVPIRSLLGGNHSVSTEAGLLLPNFDGRMEELPEDVNSALLVFCYAGTRTFHSQNLQVHDAGEARQK